MGEASSDRLKVSNTSDDENGLVDDIHFSLVSIEV